MLLLSHDIIPFATFAWSNVASKNVLIKSGYLMTWSNMAACDRSFAQKVIDGEAK